MLKFGPVIWDNKTDQELIDEAGSPLERMFWYVAAQEGKVQEGDSSEHQRAEGSG